MATIVYETADGITEDSVHNLKYKEETDCWWYYVDDDEGRNVARYIPRERVYAVERGG